MDEFQTVFHTVDVRDEVTVRIELKPGADDAWEKLKEILTTDLAAAHEGLRINVTRAESGSLPRYELKAKRFVDERGNK